MRCGAQGVVELSRTRSLENGITLEGEYASVWAPLMGDTVSITPRDAPRMEGRIDGAPFDFAEAMAAQLRDFARSVREGAAPLVGGDEGRDMVALIERLYTAAKPAALPWMQPVHLPEAL
jgi:predicted dehydrogenase